MRLPGVGVRGELLDRRRQLAAREVGDRHVLQHGTEVRAYRDPDVSEPGRRARVLDLLRSAAAHVRNRALHCADHLCDRDLVRRASEPIAAFDAALAADDSGVPQVAEDVLEELERNLLRLSDSLAFSGPILPPPAPYTRPQRLS